MSVTAYVMIESEAGQAEGVVAALRQMAFVVAADVVTGPYDVIARLEAPERRAISLCVMDEIQRVAGVRQTTTSLAV
jgi:DNA-binding Lrp family transcriptional regulator